MNNKRVYYLFIRALYIGIDIGCITLAFYLACLFRHTTLSFPITLESFFSGQFNPFRNIFLLWMAAILFCNQVNGLYQTRRELLEGFEILQVIRSVGMASLAVIILVYILKVQDFPRTVLISSVVFISVFLSLWRVAKKFFVEYLVARGYNNWNILIVGAGKVGLLLAQEVRRRPGLGLRVAGFLDDLKVGTDPSKGPQILGKIDDFADIAKREFIGTVFITVHDDNQVFLKLLEEARELGVAVRVVPQGFEFLANDFVKYNIGIVPILAYSDMVLRYRQHGKRLFDFFAATAAVFVLLPVFCVIAVLIKCDSPGPILYRSKRYGRRGEIFNMYKFRSMVLNADDLLADLKNRNEVDGPIFKIRKDPRVTKLGAFLRKYSLDELPQIFNVGIGDMSLVGPRPLPVGQVEKEDLQQLKRLEVRPGITGLWQIRGRSDVPFARLIKWDIWYINNWSFGLDLYILWQTIPVVCKGKGAY